MAINEPQINYTTEQYLSVLSERYLGAPDIPVPYDMIKDIITRLSTNETNITTNTANITTKANSSELPIGFDDGDNIGQLTSIRYDAGEGTLQFVFESGNITITVTAL